MVKKVFIFWKTHKRTIKKLGGAVVLIGFLVFGIWYINCLPDTLFNDSTSTVLLDKEGNLLGAKIAGDGQWRFSSGRTVPEKFERCLIQFEDRNFYSHFGISIRGIGRAIVQNT